MYICIFIYTNIHYIHGKLHHAREGARHDRTHDVSFGFLSYRSLKNHFLYPLTGKLTKLRRITSFN